MTDDLGSYARLYQGLRDDPKFADVYGNDHHFATYCRLLMIAEGAWPASAHLPYGIQRRSLQKLVDVDLIESKGGGLFRIVGLDAERGRRSAKAAKASNARWNAPSIARSIAEPGDLAPDDDMPNQEETSKDENEKIQDEHPREDPFDAYWSLTTRYPKAGAASWLDRLTTRYGPMPVIRDLVSSWKERADLSTLLSRTEDRLARDARSLDRAEQEAEAQRVREKRAIPKVLPAWEQEFRAILEARYPAS